MLGVSLIIIAAAIVYMVETYISTYYTIEYMHGTSLFLILLAKYGTPVLFLLLCAYIAYRNFLKKQKAAASAASERPTSKDFWRQPAYHELRAGTGIVRHQVSALAGHL